jgi:hypothetical protein
MNDWDSTSRNSNLTHLSITEYCEDQLVELIAYDEDTGRSVHFDRNKLKVVDIVMAG